MEKNVKCVKLKSLLKQNSKAK